ncbi:hypothetical protein Tsubulata_028991 [Turnera subulata]|uniref:At1g61320/AtMIF1 LRR domain-containing protein n=1 Tax=Turnera subulata TaxID=218843 RepID=A0A9Q0F505_9ROSI|nr:hypothetical protein Tsubulata_028991 [Turnera subulata]
MVAAKRVRETPFLLPSYHKRKKNDDDDVYNIDGGSVNLPDDVLDNILSFLPIRKAMQVGILSTRFSKSWLSSRRLEFGKEFARERGGADYMFILKKVFDLHAGPSIQSVKLYLNPKGKVEDLWVEGWIKKSIAKGVEELDLDFHEAGHHYGLSSALVDIETLRILKLASCRFEVPVKLRGLRFLNTLVLRKMDISSLSTDTLFCSCLSLETLDLAHVYGVSHLKIVARSLERFKVLKIVNCSRICSIHIDAPTLNSIHYCGSVPTFKVVDVSQLDDLMLNFRPSIRYSTDCFQLGDLVNCLSHVRVLTTTSTFLEGLCRGILTELRFCLPNMKEFHLFMEGALYCSPYDIAAFLKNCPALEQIFIDLNEFSFYCGLYWEFHQQPEFEKLFVPFHNLRIIKLEGFKFDTYELELAKFFLERAFNLEELALITRKHCPHLITKAALNIYNSGPEHLQRPE